MICSGGSSRWAGWAVPSSSLLIHSFFNRCKPLTATKRKRTTPNNSDQQNQVISRHLQTASAALQTLTNRVSPTHQDASALYGQLLAEKLRKLSIGTRLILQNKIDNLVFEVEYNDTVTAVARFTPSSGTSVPVTPSPSLTPQFAQLPSSHPSYTQVPVSQYSIHPSSPIQSFPSSTIQLSTSFMISTPSLPSSSSDSIDSGPPNCQHQENPALAEYYSKFE